MIKSDLLCVFQLCILVQVVGQVFTHHKLLLVVVVDLNLQEHILLLVSLLQALDVLLQLFNNLVFSFISLQHKSHSSRGVHDHSLEFIVMNLQLLSLF